VGPGEIGERLDLAKLTYTTTTRGEIAFCSACMLNLENGVDEGTNGKGVVLCDLLRCLTS